MKSRRFGALALAAFLGGGGEDLVARPGECVAPAEPAAPCIACMPLVPGTCLLVATCAPQIEMERAVAQETPPPECIPND